jgi:hypothetical protein
MGMFLDDGPPATTRAACLGTMHSNKHGTLLSEGSRHVLFSCKEYQSRLLASLSAYNSLASLATILTGHHHQTHRAQETGQEAIPSDTADEADTVCQGIQHQAQTRTRTRAHIHKCTRTSTHTHNPRHTHTHTHTFFTHTNTHILYHPHGAI